MLRMEIRCRTVHHRLKEHIGATGKRIQLFASFPAQKPSDTDTEDNSKMSVY